MPMYDYLCKTPGCDERTEDMRGFDDRNKPGPPCARCDGETEYVISGGKKQNFRFGNLWKDKRGKNLTEI